MENLAAGPKKSRCIFGDITFSRNNPDCITGNINATLSMQTRAAFDTMRPTAVYRLRHALRTGRWPSSHHFAMTILLQKPSVFGCS